MKEEKGATQERYERGEERQRWRDNRGAERESPRTCNLWLAILVVIAPRPPAAYKMMSEGKARKGGEEGRGDGGRKGEREEEDCYSRFPVWLCHPCNIGFYGNLLEWLLFFY